MATVHPGEDDGPPPNPDLEDPESEGESGDEDDPRAPAIDYKDMAQIPGYDNVNFNKPASIVPPPAKDVYGDQPSMPFKEISVLNEEDCRQALLQLVSESCCWGARPAKNMTINKITPSTAFHYILETYSESRTTKYISVPYRGGPVDGPDCGIAPGPWQIPCTPTTLFKNETILYEVPHTAVIKWCQRCDGTGYVECPRCRGKGKTTCGRCGGGGQILRRNKNRSRWVRCATCSGSGRAKCRRCLGEKEVKCPKCNGHKQLKVSIQLEVKYITHKSDYVLEMTPLPDHLVKVVKGDIVFEQEHEKVWPLTSYPLAEVNENSARLINQHKKDYAKDRYVKQRHHLRAVPVTEVDYTYGDEKKEYWVYGLEKKVYTPDYPSQCCWGCNIL